MCTAREAGLTSLKSQKDLGKLGKNDRMVIGGYKGEEQVKSGC